MNLLKMPRVVSVLSINVMVILLQCPSRTLLVREIDSDDEGLKTVVYEPAGARVILMGMSKFLEFNWV